MVFGCCILCSLCILTYLQIFQFSEQRSFIWSPLLLLLQIFQGVFLNLKLVWDIPNCDLDLFSLSEKKKGGKREEKKRRRNKPNLLVNVIKEATFSSWGHTKVHSWTSSGLKLFGLNSVARINVSGFLLIDYCSCFIVGWNQDDLFHSSSINQVSFYTRFIDLLWGV